MSELEKFCKENSIKFTHSTIHGYELRAVMPDGFVFRRSSRNPTEFEEREFLTDLKNYLQLGKKY